MKSSKTHRGFSVAEVMVALFLLTVATLGMMAALTRLMVAQDTNSHRTVATLVGESALRKAALAGPEIWDTSGTPEVHQEQVRVGQNRDLVTFRYKVEGKKLPEYAGESGPDMGDMYQLSVEIWWNSEDDPQAATERGQQRLTVGKMVYVEGVVGG